MSIATLAKEYGALLYTAFTSLSPVILVSALFTVALAGLISFYLFLLLVAHFPRPPSLSETKYQTVGPNGIELHDLPDTSDSHTGEKIGVSVVVPAYNETERMPIMLDEAIEYLNANYAAGSENGSWEILIVDDGSTDHTREVALKYAEARYEAGDVRAGQIRVCRLEKNRGKGGAVTHGMRHVRGDIAVFADADGATKFDDLGRLAVCLRECEVDGFAIAVGSRAHMVKTEAVVKRSFIRNLLMHGFHQFIAIMGIHDIADTQCGFKLFTRAAVLSVFPYMHCERWIFDIEVLILAKQLRIPVCEVPVNWHEVAGTKLNLVKDSLNMAWDLVILRAGYLMGVYKPGKRWEKRE